MSNFIKKKNKLQKGGTKCNCYKNKYKILTYNVCWGCMIGPPKGKHNQSASKLVDKCTHDKCLNNVCTTINNGGPFDLIALQECARFEDIKKRLKRNYKSIYHIVKTNNADIEFATLYNPYVFNVLAAELNHKIHNILKNI